MLAILIAAVMVANPVVERGGTVRLSPQVELSDGDQLKSYALFAYVHDVPAAYAKMRARESSAAEELNIGN